MNREVATTILEKAGYSVVEAESGNRAIELAARERFGLILMDIQMPVSTVWRQPRSCVAGWATARQRRLSPLRQT